MSAAVRPESAVLSAVQNSPLIRRFWGRELNLYIVVTMVTVLATIWAMKLWRMTPSIPLRYRDDAVSVAGYIDALMKTGWYEHQPDLGAPLGQTYYDYPMADNLHLMIIGLIVIVLPKWALAMNAYFLLGFPLAAITATWFFRSIGLARTLAGALAVLFAIAPYHFFRNENHMWLASYWPIPLFGVLIVRVLLGRGLWNRRRSPGRRGLSILTWHNAGTLAILVIAGTATQYYAVFDLIILATAGIMAFVRDRNWRRFITAAIAGVIIAGVLVINMLPDFLYPIVKGPNYEAAFRPAEHTEWFALKFVMLLLPSVAHRFAPFAELGNSYNSQFVVYTNVGVGLIASLGVIILVFTLTAAAGRRALRTKKVPPIVHGRAQKTIIDGFSGILLWILLVASTGGLAVFIALLVTTKVRGWDRLSIYIGLLGLAAVGIAVQLAVRAVLRSEKIRVPVRRMVARVGIPLLAVLILLVGVWDQTNTSTIPDYAGVKANFQEDEAYVAALEAELPDQAMVYQVPYQPFPEGPFTVNRMLDYDHLRLSLQSDTLRWSYGGVKGRPEYDWPSKLVDLPVNEFLDRVAATGFSGVSVDRLGYADGGVEFEAGLADALGVEPIVSPRGDYSYWDVTGYRERLDASIGADAVGALSYATLHPMMVYGGKNMSVFVDKAGTWEVAGDESELVFATNAAQSSTISVSFFIGATENLTSMTLTLPDGTTKELPIDPEGMPVSLSFPAEPGQNVLKLSATSKSGQSAFRVDSLNLFVG